MNPVEYPSLNRIDRHTALHLKADLDAGSISYPALAVKAHLQALCTLTYLGLCTASTAADPELLFKTTRWCRIPVSGLIVDLTAAKIKKNKNKWEDIEALIRINHSSPRLGATQDGVSDAIDQTRSSLTDLAISDNKQYPCPHVANLLLAIAHNNFSRLAGGPDWQEEYQNLTGLSVKAYPVKTLEELLLAFKTIPRFSKAIPIPTALNTLSETSETIAWIMSHCGLRHARPEFVRATDDLLIPGFRKNIHQFVLARPDPIRLEMFNAHHKFAKMRSTLLFHGTSMSALGSILSIGLTTADDERFGPGVFMAEWPSTSYDYAVGHVGYMGKGRGKTPFSDCSVLLGCEVAGSGRYVEDEQGPVHLINELGSVMVRYVFLIPTITEELPSRETIEPAMLSAFKKIAKLNVETPTS